jgi:hypothetical protein
MEPHTDKVSKEQNYNKHQKTHFTVVNKIIFKILEITRHERKKEYFSNLEPQSDVYIVTVLTF